MVLGFLGYFWPVLCSGNLYLTFGMSYAVVILYLQMVPEFPAGLNPPSSQSPRQPSYPAHFDQDIFIGGFGDDYGGNLEYKLINW